MVFEIRSLTPKIRIKYAFYKLQQLDMKAPSWLPGVVLCIGLFMISVNFWYLVYVPSKYKMEGFNNAEVNRLTNEVVASAMSVTSAERIPSDNEAAASYRNVLLYMKGNTLKGLKIVNDFNTRVYGSAQPVPDSFDPRTIMDNFTNPISGM